MNSSSSSGKPKDIKPGTHGQKQIKNEKNNHSNKISDQLNVMNTQTRNVIQKVTQGNSSKHNQNSQNGQQILNTYNQHLKNGHDVFHNPVHGNIHISNHYNHVNKNGAFYNNNHSSGGFNKYKNKNLSSKHNPNNFSDNANNSNVVPNVNDFNSNLHFGTGVNTSHHNNARRNYNVNTKSHGGRVVDNMNPNHMNFQKYNYKTYSTDLYSYGFVPSIYGYPIISKVQVQPYGSNSDQNTTPLVSACEKVKITTKDGKLVDLEKKKNLYVSNLFLPDLNSKDSLKFVANHDSHLNTPLVNDISSNEKKNLDQRNVENETNAVAIEFMKKIREKAAINAAKKNLNPESEKALNEVKSKCLDDKINIEKENHDIVSTKTANDEICSLDEKNLESLKTCLETFDVPITEKDHNVETHIEQLVDTPDQHEDNKELNVKSDDKLKNDVSNTHCDTKVYSEGKVHDDISTDLSKDNTSSEKLSDNKFLSDDLNGNNELNNNDLNITNSQPSEKTELPCIDKSTSDSKNLDSILVVSTNNHLFSNDKIVSNVNNFVVNNDICSIVDSDQNLSQSQSCEHNQAQTLIDSQSQNKNENQQKNTKKIRDADSVLNEKEMKKEIEDVSSVTFSKEEGKEKEIEGVNSISNINENENLMLNLNLNEEANIESNDSFCLDKKNLNMTISTFLDKVKNSIPIEDIENFKYSKNVKYTKPFMKSDVVKYRYDKKFLMQFSNLIYEKDNEFKSLTLSLDHSVIILKRVIYGQKIVSKFGNSLPNRYNNQSSNRSALINDSRQNIRSSQKKRMSNISSKSNSTKYSKDSKKHNKDNLDNRDDDVQNFSKSLDVKPLEKTADRWIPRSKIKSSEIKYSEDGTQILTLVEVERKVKSLLNKLALETFETITNDILNIAKQSAWEKDASTIKKIIQLTFEKACDEPFWSEMYAKFCAKICTNIQNNVIDETIVLKDGTHPSGGPLARRLLISTCQTEYEKGWTDKLPTNIDGTSLEPEMMSDEYYEMATTKRRGLGLVKFIGHLYNLGMLNDQVIFVCLRDQCKNFVDPSEDILENLVQLVKTVGLKLDSEVRTRSILKIVFENIKKILENVKLPPRIVFMLMDLQDLRKQKWVFDTIKDNVPKTAEEIHKDNELSRMDDMKPINEKKQKKINEARSNFLKPSFVWNNNLINSNKLINNSKKSFSPTNQKQQVSLNNQTNVCDSSTQKDASKKSDAVQINRFAALDNDDEINDIYENINESDIL